MIKNYPVLVRLCVIFACAILGGLSIKWRADSIPTDYTSLAEVVLCADAAKILSPGNEETALGVLAAYLVSPEMDQRANDRTITNVSFKKGDSEFQPGKIQSIRCKAGKEPGHILIFVTGTECKFTQQYLNALLDELMQNWHSINKIDPSDLESIRLMEKLHVLKTDLDSLNDQIMATQQGSVRSSDQMQKLRNLGGKVAEIRNQQADLNLLLESAKSKERELQLWVKTRASWAYPNEWEASWESIITYSLVGAFLGICLVSLTDLVRKCRPPPLQSQA